MLISISNEKTKAIIYDELTEAEMDETGQRLSDNPEGICSIGQATCYAVVVSNSTDSALWHVCLEINACVDEVEQTIANFKLTAPNEKINIVLARSPAGYIEDKERQKARHPNEPHQTVEEYFRETDQIYTDAFSKLLEEQDITPQFIDMPHDFLVINSKNELCLFKEYAAEEITWDEVETKKKIKKKHLLTEEAPTSISNNNYTSNKDNTFFHSEYSKIEQQSNKSERMKLQSDLSTSLKRPRGH